MIYFNTAFSLAMLAQLPANLSVEEVSIDYALELLDEGFVNAANPNHANTLDAVSRILDFDVRDGSGSRVELYPGDCCLVAQVVFPPEVPRNTAEYTDEQLNMAEISLIMVMA